VIGCSAFTVPKLGVNFRTPKEKGLDFTEKEATDTPKRVRGPVISAAMGSKEHLMVEASATTASTDFCVPIKHTSGETTAGNAFWPGPWLLTMVTENRAPTWATVMLGTRDPEAGFAKTVTKAGLPVTTELTTTPTDVTPGVTESGKPQST
jgi:hypothetical protein